MPDRPRDLLRVEGLQVSYAGAVQVLHEVTVTVPDGAVVAVLGSNGAGKSTLLRAISGTLRGQRGRVTGGDIVFDGDSLVGMDPAEIVRRGVVQVPEGRRVFAELTVEENLRVGGYAVDRARRLAARERVYDLFPVLADRRNQRGGLLSGGQQQMLAMGRALMGAPRVLLLDEPSLGLAPQLVSQVGEIITMINAQGTAVLLIEQNASMGLSVADQAVVLEVGRVVAAAPAAELAGTDEIRDRYLGVGGSAPHTADDTQPDGVGVGADDPRADETGDPRADETGDPRADETGDPRGDETGDPRGEEIDVQTGDRGDGTVGRVLASGPTGLVSRRPHPLHVEDLTVRFGGIMAMDAVRFTLEPGTIHALIGPNGAGKSTCINVLSGVYRPTSGRVRYGDHDLGSVPPHRIAELGVSRTFQNLSLSPALTVADSLMVGRHRLMAAGVLAAGLRLPSARREERRHRETVQRLGDLLGLTDHLSAPIETLPYGDRKRVELARALCGEPEVLLLDEPVAGMNHEESQRMAAAIRGIRSELGISILVVEHDMTFVMGIADHVTVLDFGRCIADGPPDVVRSDPAVIEAYLGGAAA